MDLTIICPTYNERSFIDRLVASLCLDDGVVKEVFLVDGGSGDGTRERVSELCRQYSNLRLIDNPHRTSTAAFNLAFKQSTGKYIAFVGAHAEYNTGYFKTGVGYLERNESEVVGGPLTQKGKGLVGRAIALVMSDKMGVGNTEFRTRKEKMYVDSVAFAIYKREVVEQVGLMDEDLPVNQDDEFHYRIKHRGYRILMVPEMNAVYYVRDSYRKLFRQYFRYGLYKPLVLKKISGAWRWRHLVPAAFTLYVLSLPIGCYWWPWFIPGCLYLLSILVKSISFKTDFVTRLLCLPVFPVLHLSYGIGFIIGFRKTLF